jgi:PhnB protein
MKGSVKPVPEDFHTVTPHLVIRDADRAIEFYKRAFGAEELRVHRGPDGKSVMHASVKIGDSIVMLSDEFPDFQVLSPLSLGGSSVTLHLYVEDVDAAFDRAVSAGATVRMPVEDQFWGDRYGSLEDPFGHKWSIATHIQDLSEEEIEEAGKAAFAKMTPQEQTSR